MRIKIPEVRAALASYFLSNTILLPICMKMRIPINDCPLQKLYKEKKSNDSAGRSFVHLFRIGQSSRSSIFGWIRNEISSRKVFGNFSIRAILTELLMNQARPITNAASDAPPTTRRSAYRVF